MGKKSRTKGAVAENDVCKLIAPIHEGAQRELDQYQDKLGRDIKGCAPLCIQVKRYKKIHPGDIRTAYSEALSALDGEYLYPVVFYREDRRQWRVSTDMGTLMEISNLAINPSPRLRELIVDMDAREFVNYLAQGYTLPFQGQSDE